MDNSRIRVLIVDRDPDSATNIAEVLRPIGYQISVATHEVEAIDLAEKTVFNVVVKAFHPSQVDAIALMDRIRSITPDTQLIFLSERGTIQTAVDAIRRGAYDFLSKPVDPVKLIESVRKSLDCQSLIAEDQQITDPCMVR